MNYKERFTALYDMMSKSADIDKMRAFGYAAKEMFEKVAKQHPDIAEEWLEKLTPVLYHNYLSEEEAGEIAMSLVNQNGSEGAHWPREDFARMLNRLGAPMEEEPYYNKCALWVAANMVYSDHANSIAEDMGFNTPGNVPPERMAKSCYKKAVEILKDVDRPHFIRWYFHLS